MLPLRIPLRWSAPRLSHGLATISKLSAERDCSSITPPYAKLIGNLERIREYIKKPLTLAEKILYSHLHDVEATFSNGSIKRGETYLQLAPERVAMQDASAQMAL